MSRGSIIQVQVNSFHQDHLIHYSNSFIFIPKFYLGNFHYSVCRHQLWTYFCIASWRCRLACLLLGNHRIRASPYCEWFVALASKSCFWIERRRWLLQLELLVFLYEYLIRKSYYSLNYNQDLLRLIPLGLFYHLTNCSMSTTRLSYHTLDFLKNCFFHY